MSPLAHYFADELKRAREDAGLTQEQLAKAINFTRSPVALVETCRRTPTLEFCCAVDNQLSTGGRFERMREALMRAEATPEWFRPWTDYEREATVLRDYAAMLVPGLLQVQQYARSVLRDEDKVAARMERQRALETAETTVILEKGVLHRRVGDPVVMAEQLESLAGAPATVRVLPYDAGVYAEGSFVLATVGGRDHVYFDAPLEGIVRDNPEVVSAVRQRWEGLLAEALPRTLSRELILKEAERWKNH